MHAEAGDLLVHVEDRVPLPEAVHEHAHGAELEPARPHPHQVRGQARELGHDHSERVGARRHHDAHQLFDRERVGEVVDGRRQVVVAVGHRDALLPAQRFHLLFDAGVQIADDRLQAAHLLAVEVDDEAEHAVRRRMVGTEVDREQLATERAFLAGLGDGDALGDGVRHAFSGGVCQVSCSSENSTTSPPTG